jgi:hypothetical protein
MTFAARYTLGQLAGLADLGIGLPLAVSQAIAAHAAAQTVPVPALPHPGEPARQAVRDLAAELARTAAESATPRFDVTDVSAVSEARASEQRAIDQHAVAVELRDASARLLGATVATHRAEVIAAIQARHQAAVAELVKRARRLPPGATDETALETGGQHRADWIACRDLAAELDRLRSALRMVDDGTPPDPVDGVAFCAAWERSGKLAQTWLAPEITTMHGAPGSLEFWLSAAREDYEWWLPTSDEQAARIAELHATRHTQRVQAASAF